jgi:RNA-directed DNA polymerase
MSFVPPPPLATAGDVARLLGVPLQRLTWWVYVLPEARRYDEFTISRRAGGERQIAAPIKPIKDTQRSLASHFAPAYEPRPNVHGYVPDRGPMTNASRHQRQRLVLRVDLRDFYPSIHFGRVRGLFRSYPFNYPDDVAQLLAHICCHRGSLPLGAPTSPMISNFISRGLDSALVALAAAERSYYTRYADDLCFSTRRASFTDRLIEYDSEGRAIASSHLTGVVSAEGFEINHGKTRLMRHSQRQRVTGLVVNDRINVSRDYVRELGMLLHIWDRFGQDEAAASFLRSNGPRNAPPRKPLPSFVAILGGRVQHVGSVKGWTSPVYQDLARRLQALEPTFSPRTLKRLHNPQGVKLYTEGITDPKHLLAAQRYFHDRGEFTNLRLITVEETACGSDSELRAMAKALAVTDQQIPCICVFDRDNPSQLDPAVGPTVHAPTGTTSAHLRFCTPPGATEPKAFALRCSIGTRTCDVLTLTADMSTYFETSTFATDSTSRRTSAPPIQRTRRWCAKTYSTATPPRQSGLGRRLLRHMSKTEAHRSTISISKVFVRRSKR